MLKHLVIDDNGMVKPGATYTAIALALIVGGYFVWYAWAGTDAPMKRGMMCMNESCNHVVERRPELGETIPAVCPKCGQNTFVPTKDCPKCGTPVILNEYRGLKPPAICPNCKHEVWYGRSD